MEENNELKQEPLLAEEEEYTSICGEVMPLQFDKEISNLNAELGVTKIGAPVIVLQDWGQSTTDKDGDETFEDGEEKDLVVLHLDEAIRLKAVIESLILSANLFEREYVEELMQKAGVVDEVSEQEESND